jgi:hypothetical protein
MVGNAKTVKIGCSSAFWGDSIHAAKQLLPHVEYLVADYLAEVTMGILAKRKEKTGEGFIKEFVTFLFSPLLEEIIPSPGKKGVKIVCNAGGLDPIGLKELMEETARNAGFDVPLIAAVSGDDILLSVKEKKFNLIPFATDGSEGKDFDCIPEDINSVSSLNAYLGAFPIAKALELGAQIVITGRCVDSALVLGPLIYEFGWTPLDYDKLASGSLAGHIIECGCQATGGNMTICYP